MILATLGSNKLVTTLDAIMTELFTGIKPDKILILREDSNITQLNLSPVLETLGLKSEVEIKVLGEGIKSWREGLKGVNIDVADITPGRKYMAIAVLNYSNAREIRYAYLREEDKGYHIFGYVPLSEITVYDIRTGESVNYEALKTVKGEKEVTLQVDSLQALLNLYRLLGKVEFDYNVSQDVEEMCEFRAGIKRFAEEEEIKSLVDDYLFLADTNVYMKLGDRIRGLTWSKEKGARLLPSKAVYNELLGHTISTQKGVEDLKFHIAMGSFRRIHKQPPVSEIRKSGDVGIIEEAKALKRELMEALAIITADEKLSIAAQSQGVKSILLHKIRNGKGYEGEFLYCLSTYNKVSILVDGKEYSFLPKHEFVVDKMVKVNNINKDYNYAYLLNKLEGILHQKSF